MAVDNARTRGDVTDAYAAWQMICRRRVVLASHFLFMVAAGGVTRMVVPLSLEMGDGRWERDGRSERREEMREERARRVSRGGSEERARRGDASMMGAVMGADACY